MGSIADTTIAELQKQIGEKYGQAFGDLAGTFLPGLYKMSLRELTALRDLVDAKKYADAQQALLNKMTLDELAEQKAQLAELARRMANEKADAAEWWNNFVGAGLKMALSAFLPVVFL